MKKIAVIVSLFVAILFSACSSSKQTTEETIKNVTMAIDSGRWTFTPTYMMPQIGNSKQVYGSYFVIYKINDLNIYLPYYGRAYSGADVLSNTGPLDLVSKDFSMEKKLIEPGKWEINIKPNDSKELQLMTFTFFTNGTADLHVLLQNRSPISFTGSVQLSKNKE